MLQNGYSVDKRSEASDNTEILYFLCIQPHTERIILIFIKTWYNIITSFTCLGYFVPR